MNLSEEQKKRIEANRIRALELQKQRNQRALIPPHNPNQPSTFSKLQPESHSTLHKFRTQSVQSEKESPDNRSSSTFANGDSAGQPLNNGKDFADQRTMQQKIEESRKRAIALRASKSSLTSNQQKNHISPIVNSPTINSPIMPSTIKEGIPLQNDISSYSGPVHLATCCLLSPSRFYVSTKFHSQLIAIIKDMPSRCYDTKTCKWSLHVDEHDRFLESCKFLKPQVTVEPLPKFISSCLKSSNRTLKTISASNPLLGKLLPFQKEGVEFVLTLNGRAIIADDMGLGKTIQVMFFTYIAV